ncbi:hypothetical protein AM588_10010347 [Phytophthora nicotianae]|uniref:Uncharacterized protein n=1 Tax=Phytophthora nicotianae TaxID=4792 RepID=A0A0W8DA76_PHYNI|nr:hypothetical protein AM588_10010347 [Phytophthora nicotianae]
MSSNFTRDATVPSSTSAQSSTATVTSSSTTTTTTATASTNPNANANNSSTSPSGSSPSSSGDGNGRPGNAQQSSGSDGSSPMRRLPTVLRAPPGANSGTPSNATSAPVATAASTTRSQTQAQAAQQQGQSQSHSAINTATAGVDDREYINFCDGRPDVYYLHQRLHLRPDLLHLIKSNEYIDEKCTSDASETIAHEQQQAQQQQQAGPLVGTGSPLLRAHKRYKRSTPMAAGSASTAYNSARAIAAFRNGNADGSGAANGGNSGDNGLGQGSGDSRGHSPEENSTENSETTGEEASSNTANSNASNSSQDVSMRAALAEQKYFGLLLQNFEVIFESLHNKKVLLATLRKDSKAPDHLIADLHDDIHVLSALKKEFRNKLRRTIQ